MRRGAAAAANLSTSEPLLQIEEPAPRSETDPGLTIGLVLSDDRIEIAVSVGGNAEIVALPSGLSLRDALKQVIALTGRMVTGAVAVLPPDADAAAMFQAIEAAGIEVLRLIRPDEALAAAEGGEAVLGAARIAEDMR